VAAPLPTKKITPAEMVKQLLSQLGELEDRFACDTCGYCCKRYVYRAELPCGHAFCAACLDKLTKITKIGKATNKFGQEQNIEGHLL